MFYKHIPSKDIPNLKPEERSLKEFEKGEEALQSIKEDVEFVMNSKKVILHITQCSGKLINLGSNFNLLDSTK